MTDKPRGRPRSFDTDQALDRALDVFWSTGFTASSLDELCDAMGIARPSLYAAFGDKEDLYLAALARFRELMAQTYREANQAAGSARDAVVAFLDGAIARYTSGRTARGCLAVCTATSEAPSHPRVRAALAELVGDLDRAHLAMLTRARDTGELPGGADVALLAQVLSGVQQSIAVRARAGVRVEELEALAHAVVTLVFGKPRKRGAHSS
jgi:AcrR family transcriptional regulator